MEKNSRIVKYELDPICPFCGGDVVYTTNDKLYGKLCGNGRCYMCTTCRASVGVHNDENRVATGIPLGRLADPEMKRMREACHERFDRVWKFRYLSRKTAYKRLAYKLKIDVDDCHFAFLGKAQLQQAYDFMEDKDWYRLPENKQYNIQYLYRDYSVETHIHIKKKFKFIKAYNPDSAKKLAKKAVGKSYWGTLKVEERKPV